MSSASGRMRAAVYREKRRLVVEERPVPEPGPHDVLLRVSHCGVCGSDFNMVLASWGRPGSIGGHGFSGRIEALGSALTRWGLRRNLWAGPPRRCAIPTARSARPGSWTTARA